MKESRGPIIIAIVVLLFPVLYIVSYLLLVVRQKMVAVSLTYPTQYSADFYRYGGNYAEAFYWPLEQIDRRLQPGAWSQVEQQQMLILDAPSLK